MYLDELEATTCGAEDPWDTLLLEIDEVMEEPEEEEADETEEDERADEVEAAEDELCCCRCKG